MFSSVPASKLNNQDHFAVAPDIPQQEEQQHMPPNVAGQGERFVKLRRSAVPMELDQQQRDLIAAASGGKMKKNTFVESFGIPHEIIPANVAAHFPSATEYFPSLANMWDPVSTSPEQLGKGQQQQNNMTEYSRLAICQSLQSRRQGLSMYDFDRHADVHNRRVKRLDDLVRGLQAKGRHRMGRVKGLQRGAGGETGNTDQLLHDLLQQQQRSASPMLNNNDGAMMMSSTSGAAARHWHSTENEAAMASSITRIGKLKEKSRQMDITVSNDFISPGDGTAASEKKILDEAKKTFVLSFEQPESVSMALIASHFPNTSSRSFAEFTSNSAATPSLNIPLAEEEFQRFEPLRERRARIAMLEQFRNIAAAIRREELLVRRQAILEDKALRSRDVIQCHNRVKRQVLSGVNKAEVELNASYDGNAKAIALFPATVLSYTNPKNFILVSDLPVRGVTYGDVERHFPNTSARMRHRMADLQMKIQTQLAATPMARNKDINKRQGILAMGGGGGSSRKNASFSNKNKSLIAGSAAHQSWDLLQEASSSLDSTTTPSAMTLDEVSYVDDLRANAVDSEDRAELRFALLPFIRRHTALFDWNIRHKSADYRRSEFERAKIFAAFDNDVWRSREAALRRAKMLNNRIANNELKMSSAEHRRAAILNGRVQNLLQKDMLRQKKLQRAADWRKERKAAGLPLSDPLMENLAQKERFAQYKNIDDVPLLAEPVMDFTDPKPAFLTLDTVGAHFPNASRVYSSCNELNNRVWNRRERVAERAADKSDAASDRYKTLMAEKQAKLQELDRIRKEKVAKAKQNRKSNTNTPNDSNLAAGATGADHIITSDQSQPTMANLVVEARPMMMDNDVMSAEVDNNQQRDVMAAGGAGAGTGADRIITSDQSQPTMANLVVEAGPIMMDDDVQPQLQQQDDMAAGAANIMTSDQQQPHGSNVVAGAKPIMNDNDADMMMKAKNQEMASPLQAENPHPSVDMAAGEAGASTGASDIITADQQQPNASNVVTEQQDDQQKSLPADVKSRSAPLAAAAPATAAAATTEEKMKAEAAQPASAPSASSAQQQQQPAQDPPILMNAPKPRESKTGRKGLLCC